MVVPIRGTTGRAAAAGPAGRPGGASSGFRLPGATDGAERAEGASAAAGATPVGGLGLLMLQETVPDAPDARARRHGEALLRELRALQAELLRPGGGGDPARLRRLAALATDPVAAADPALAETLEAIALRARVELVRLEIAGPSRK